MLMHAVADDADCKQRAKYDQHDHTATQAAIIGGWWWWG